MSASRPLDDLAGADDAHPVGERLGLAEDVAGQQNRAPAVAQLGHALAEGLLHQRVEAAGRLVEQVELGVRRERGDERDLLPVALRAMSAFLVGSRSKRRAARHGAPRRDRPAGGRAGR